MPLRMNPRAFFRYKVAEPPFCGDCRLMKQHVSKDCYRDTVSRNCGTTAGFTIGYGIIFIILNFSLLKNLRIPGGAP